MNTKLLYKSTNFSINIIISIISIALTCDGFVLFCFLEKEKEECVGCLNINILRQIPGDH